MKQRSMVAKQQKVSRQGAHELERELSMRGWEEQRGQQQGFASLKQRHISVGIGRHLARSFKGHV